MKRIVIVFMVIILFLLAGCTNTEPTTEPQLYVTAPPITQSSTPIDNSAYPAPIIESGYPGADIIQEAVTSERIILDTGFDPDQPAPTPSANQTTVTGYVVFEETDAPLMNVSVTLAEIYRNEEGDGAFVYDTATSPYALTDDNGRFIFADVAPAEYIMVIGNIEVNRYELLTEPDGASRILSLPPGEILDLGVIGVALEW